MAGGRLGRGCFVVFEGIDGAGTTTQVERLARRLRGERRVVHITREPSDGPLGVQLRLALSGRLSLGSVNQAHAMALLFAADRLDHLDHEILPHLRDGAVVLSDRYDLSSLAYQWASAGAEADTEQLLDWLRTLNRYARRPDATIVLDVSASVAEQRRLERRGAVELYEVATLQARLTEIYRDAERLVPNDRVIHIDSEQPVDEVEAAVLRELGPLLAP